MAARVLAGAAVSIGLAAPGFRCPPRLPGADRSLRRRIDGSAIVAVRVRGRPGAAVIADMVEGVIASNRLGEQEAAVARRALWDAVGELEIHRPAAAVYRSAAARVA